MNRRIKSCATVDALAALALAEAGTMDHANVSHCLHRMARMHRDSRPGHHAPPAVPLYPQPQPQPQLPPPAQPAAHSSPPQHTALPDQQSAPQEHDGSANAWAPRVQHLSQSLHPSSRRRSSPHPQHLQHHQAQRRPYQPYPPYPRSQPYCPALDPSVLAAMRALTARMHALIGTYDSWSTCISLWSYATLSYSDEQALMALCCTARQQSGVFKPADCVSVVLAVAELDLVQGEDVHPDLRRAATDLLRQLVTASLDIGLEEFKPDEAVQLLWAFARADVHPGLTLIDEAVEAVGHRVGRCSSKQLTMLLWGLMRLGYTPGPRLLHEVEGLLLGRLELLSPTDASIAAWAFPNFRYKPVRLLDQLPAAALPALRSYGDRELVMLMAGYASAFHYHRVFLDGATAALLPRLPRLRPRELCVALWALGAFHHRPRQPGFGRAMAEALHDRLPAMAPQGLAMAAKALAQLQWRSEALLGELAAQAEAKILGFKPLEMSQLLWGLSTLKFRELPVYYAVVRRCIAILQDPGHPHYRTMQHRVLNSVLQSCQAVGYVPWALIDFAESKGIRVKQPHVLDSRDEDDEAVALAEGVVAEVRARLGQGQEDGEQGWEEEQEEEDGELGRKRRRAAGMEAAEEEQEEEEALWDLGKAAVDLQEPGAVHPGGVPSLHGSEPHPTASLAAEGQAPQQLQPVLPAAVPLVPLARPRGRAPPLRARPRPMGQSPPDATVAAAGPGHGGTAAALEGHPEDGRVHSSDVEDGASNGHAEVDASGSVDGDAGDDVLDAARAAAAAGAGGVALQRRPSHSRPGRSAHAAPAL